MGSPLTCNPRGVLSAAAVFSLERLDTSSGNEPLAAVPHSSGLGFFFFLSFFVVADWAAHPLAKIKENLDFFLRKIGGKKGLLCNYKKKKF